MTLPVAPADIPDVDNLSIINVMDDPQFFFNWFRNPSWANWRVCLKAAFGLPLETEEEEAIYQQCTGRDAVSILPVSELWCIAGRRSGKSIIAALCAVFLAVFKDFSAYLQPGEYASVLCLASDRKQARTILRYAKAFLSTPLLKPLIQRETQSEIELLLPSGVHLIIEIQTASFKSVRSYTVVSCICDETSFWKNDDGSPFADKEILAGLRPAMATIPSAMLISISSPYGRKGQVWQTFQKHYGKSDSTSTLVWKASSTTMNPLLSQHIIDKAVQDDAASARSEWFGEFRNDLETFCAVEVVDSCIIPARVELPATRKSVYHAFCDAASGSAGDSFAMGISHFERGKAVLDKVVEWRPPFKPTEAIVELAELLKTYHCTSVCGDKWGGGWVQALFEEQGVKYVPSARTKSELYLELAPALNSMSVELLDSPRLKAQLCDLERRTGRGAKDSVDHSPGAHDDVINAACGSLILAAEGKAGLECFGIF